MLARKRTRKSPLGKVHIIVFFCCAIAVALIALGLKVYRDHAPLLKVGENRISREEYNWAMYAARDDILSLHTANGISPIRWDEETALGLPYEMVAERAVQILREFHAVSDLAEERGYLEDGSFSALRDEMEKANRQRTEAISSGGIITGLRSYDLAQYIAYRTSGLRRQFCDDDTNPEMQVSAEEVRQRYEADKSHLYIMEDSLVLHYVEIYSGQESSGLEADVRQLQQNVQNGSSMQEAIQAMPQLQEYYQELTLDGEAYASYARTYADLLAFSSDLQTGDLSEVICEGVWIYLIECVERTDHDYQPLEDVYAVVERSILEERYDALIAQRTEQMEADYNAETLYRYTAQMLK